MKTLHEIFSAAIKREASDIHITVGKPVIFRIDGDLVEADENVLSPSDVEALAYPLFREDDRLSTDFKYKGEIDFAQTVEQGVRIRANIYKERG